MGTYDTRKFKLKLRLALILTILVATVLSIVTISLIPRPRRSSQRNPEITTESTSETTTDISTTTEEEESTLVTIVVNESLGESNFRPDWTTHESPDEETPPELPEEELYLNLTESEKLILATLVRLECGGSSYECQMAVASVVVNRMEYWGLSLREVVFAKNQFSPARLINKETGASHYPPYESCWRVVEDICKNGPSLPYYVMYFRAGRHHTWAVPYCQIDGTYFSYSTKYM